MLYVPISYMPQPENPITFAEAETPEVKCVEEKCAAPIFPWGESARTYKHEVRGKRSPTLYNGDELRAWANSVIRDISNEG